jgi:hypothetical protein
MVALIACLVIFMTLVIRNFFTVFNIVSNLQGTSDNESTSELQFIEINEFGVVLNNLSLEEGAVETSVAMEDARREISGDRINRTY